MKLTINTLIVKCDACGETFMPGQDEEGYPNGVAFELENGLLINICSPCIMKSDNDAIETFLQNKLDEMNKGEDDGLK